MSVIVTYGALMRSARFPEMEVGAGSKSYSPTRWIERHDPVPASMDAQGTTFVVVLGERLPDRQYRMAGESAML